MIGAQTRVVLVWHSTHGALDTAAIRVRIPTFRVFDEVLVRQHHAVESCLQLVALSLELVDQAHRLLIDRFDLSQNIGNYGMYWCAHRWVSCNRYAHCRR